ncbi:hypothetical protein AB0M68_27865 [Streptomyces sp. NPDC051453]|uniref:hypothetical protein n=1 Tax=Streptomyces sp. NPDC051453 TaxID=3154941 RepID=UPI0034479BA7
MFTPSAPAAASITSPASKTLHVAAKSLAEADKAKTIIQPRLFRVRRTPDAPTRARLWGHSRPHNS